MVFSSPIFLFFFLPLVFMAVMLVPRRHANTVLVLASLLFYAWGEGELVVIMLLSIVSNYLFGLAIGARAGQRGGRLYLACGIAFNLGLLGLFKYLNFVVDNLNVLLGPLGAAPIMLSPVHLPIGISFFSFQALSYLVDTYRGDCAPQRSLKSLALYITMFPQLIAGPIIRYRQIAEQIEHRVLSYPKALAGAERFIVGLFKKMMIANTLGAVADLVFAQPYGSLPEATAWLGAVAYSFQIYFDFSGYSDMAIGLCLLFGFSIPENFRYPYTASSVREFYGNRMLFRESGAGRISRSSTRGKRCARQESPVACT